MTSNVVNLPTYGKAISLDDQGVYFTLNPSTGAVHSIIQLVYDDEWYLFQLQKTGQEDEAGWIMMTEEIDGALVNSHLLTNRTLFIMPLWPFQAMKCIDQLDFTKPIKKHCEEPSKLRQSKLN